jgi:hypothetical protein
MRRRLWFRIYLSFIWLLSLTACHLPITNPPQYHQQLHQEKYLPQSFFLCEVNNWRTGQEVYLSEENNVCSPWIGGQLPSFQDYVQDPEKWQAWHKSPFGFHYRILAIAKQNTQYHVIKIIQYNDNVMVQWLILDNGPCSGSQVKWVTPVDAMQQDNP